MKIARLKQGSEIFFAEERDGFYYKIKGSPFDIKGICEEALGGSFELLAPCEPSKIIALGANYAKHAQELNLEIKPEPLIFLKPPTAIINPGEQIVLAHPENRTDYEAELVVVMGKKCKNISANEAKNYILGYTCGNDVSDRVLQKGDGQWARAKGFDTYCPLGPHIVTGIEPDNLCLKAILNGRVVQQGTTAEMITGVYDAVAFISGVMTLLPGDIIMTGTPDGIGPLSKGDVIEIKIEKIGSLVNHVI